MELGDFTKLAKEYVNRVGYSETALVLTFTGKIIGHMMVGG